MRISTMGWGMMGAGIFAILAELCLAILLSGRSIASQEVYRDGATAPPVGIAVSADDMPVRINVTARGTAARFRGSGRNRNIGITLDYGNGDTPDEIVFTPGQSGPRKSRVSFISTQTVMPEGKTLGRWDLSLDVRVGSRVDLDSVSVDVKADARPVNMPLVVFFGVFAVLGIGIGMMGRGD